MVMMNPGDYEEDANAQVTHIETPKARHITRKVQMRQDDEPGSRLHGRPSNEGMRFSATLFFFCPQRGDYPP